MRVSYCTSALRHSCQRFIGHLLILGVALMLVGCSQPHEFNGTKLDPPPPATDFLGTNWDGRPFRLSDLRGRVVLLFFGYTSCPDVCPMTLAEMQKIEDQLDELAEGLSVVMVTIDPERDTVERLAQYIPAFDPTFYGVVLDESTLTQVKSAYGIYAEKVESDTSQNANYMMDHTGSTLVIDKAGNWRTLYSFGTDTDAILEDLRYLLTE